ncbi:putative quinol monooxygenase [Spirosoma arcticum]
MITILSSFKAKDADASERLHTMLLELKEQAPLEQGYVQYELFRTTEDPTVFYVKEGWANQSDVDEHLQQLEANGYLGQAVEFLAEPITSVTLTEL